MRKLIVLVSALAICGASQAEDKYKTSGESKPAAAAQSTTPHVMNPEQAGMAQSLLPKIPGLTSWEILQQAEIYLNDIENL